MGVAAASRHLGGLNPAFGMLPLMLAQQARCVAMACWPTPPGGRVWPTPARPGATMGPHDQQVSRMQTETQASPELTRLCALIEANPVAMLTTQDSEGQLVSRPMSVLAMDAQGALWFFTDLRSTKVEQLRGVNLAFADRSHASYVSLSGRGEIDTDRARIQQWWTPFAKPWFPDGPDSPALALLKFVPASAEYWDAPGSRMVRLLAMVASSMAGKPLGMGEHDSFPDLAATHRLAV